jgi:DNA helicase-2/ATP-dependent DNA helicase PcrA
MTDAGEIDDALVIHLFDVEGRWVVIWLDQRQSFELRADAFAKARALARHHAPSRLVMEAPPDEAPVISTTPARPTASAHVAAPGRGATPDRIVVRHPAMLRGPDALGRSLLIEPGVPVPDGWVGCEQVILDAGAMDDVDTLRRIRHAFFTRQRLVLVVDRDRGEPDPVRYTGPIADLPIDLDFVAEAIWHLATANAVDARHADGASFAPVSRAVTLGATRAGDADVLLPDGSPAWCDGGPLTLFAPADLGAAVLPRRPIEHGQLSPLTTHVPAVLLADDQHAAVVAPEPRARIIAPAGSGKTRVLTERARHLLGAGVPPSALTMVAYNRRAQAELAQRAAGVAGLRIKTLNALSLAIVNGTDGFAPQPVRRRTIDEQEVRRIIDGLVTLTRRANTDPAAAWIDALAAARLRLRSPRQVEADFGGDVDGFADVFDAFRRRLADGGLLDFDEQIYRAIEILVSDPLARQIAQQRVGCLLVDEFQDLAPAHMLLLRLLAGPELGIVGVGDDDQTIYGFTGAAPAWLVDFDHFVPDAGDHPLHVNYRCPRVVVEAASNLLTRNAVRVPKAIHAGPDAVADPRAMAVVEHPSPTAATRAEILELVDAGVAPRDICVLTRVNAALAPVQAALVGADIAFHRVGGDRLLERGGVAAALAWLRMAIDPAQLDPRDVELAARRPSRGLQAHPVSWMAEQRDVRSLHRLAGRIADERTATKITAFARDLERLARRATTATTVDLVEMVRGELGLERTLETLDAAHRGRNDEAHSDDLRALAALAELEPDPRRFPAFLRDALRTPSVDDGVTLATVHSVKGLEWPHVIVHDASRGAFPHHLSTDVEEERRVFHVAITRCRTSLRIVAEQGAPSIFLAELAAPGAPPAARAQRATSTASTPTARGTQIEAAAGSTFQWGGYTCEVLDVGAEGAIVAIGDARLSVAYGSTVAVDGRTGELIAPRPSRSRREAPSRDDADPALLEQLKAWRLERSRADQVPAYVVATDKVLEAIAAERPRSVTELLGIPGIGPKKVELYGDELLAMVTPEP